MPAGMIPTTAVEVTIGRPWVRAALQVVQRLMGSGRRRRERGTVRGDARHDARPA